jgi:hypothetical protein
MQLASTIFEVFRTFWALSDLGGFSKKGAGPGITQAVSDAGRGWKIKGGIISGPISEASYFWGY